MPSLEDRIKEVARRAKQEAAAHQEHIKEAAQNAKAAADERVRKANSDSPRRGITVGSTVGSTSSRVSSDLDGLWQTAAVAVGLSSWPPVGARLK